MAIIDGKITEAAKMAISDARVRYTKKTLRDCFIALLKEKPIQNITVKELCEMAEINRATFYTHYANPYDLMKQIEDELFEELTNKVLLKFGAKESEFDELMKLAFDIVAENRELCQILFSENGNNRFLNRVLRLARDSSFSRWRKDYPGVSKYQLEYLFAFVVNGAVAVIEQWLQLGMKETPVDLADIVNQTSEAWLRPKRQIETGHTRR
jgi:AcrR family transcriptional regulator